MKLILAVLIVALSTPCFSQINPADSSIQVIGYWSKKDKQTYNVSYSKYRVNGSDTTARETIAYQVDITIADSTAKSYTIEWFYRDFDVSGSNEFTKSVASIFTNIKVVIKTDEMGSFQEVVNWKEVRDEIGKAFGTLKKKFKDVPQVAPLLDNAYAMYTTKESIESAAIQDVQQFYSFHGARYVLNENLEQKLVSNGIKGSPIDFLMTVRLDELNPEDDNGVLRYWKEFDQKQMTDATYEMMKQINKSSGELLIPRSEMPDVSFEENVGTRIHGSSGWVIFSILTRQTITGDESSVEERKIEIL